MDETERIIEANVVYHSALAETYDQEQPHFKQENVSKVDALIRSLAAECGNRALLDLGCGTGFILNIAKKYFERVTGVDITQKMLDRVDRTGDVELCKSETSDIPLETGSFDVCTAYGFLHHLHDVTPTFVEAFRLLKKGGIFYADLDPNYYYWDLMKEIQNVDTGDEIMKREVESVCGKIDEVSEQFNLDKEVIALAEYQKMVKGGLREELITQSLHKAGFESVDFRYEWYLGQAHYLHHEAEAGVEIEKYLRRFLPATRHLFKYVSFRARK